MNAQGQKTGGRQKGTPNKITAEIREFLASLVFDNMDLIRQDIKDMTPEQRASFLPKILPYIVPKQKPKTEKDEQDIACDHVKSFLNLAQIVNSWEQDQQPSQNPAEAHLQNLPVPNIPASNGGLQPLEQPRSQNPAEALYQSLYSSMPPLSNDGFRPLEQPLSQNPAETPHQNFPDLNAINSNDGFQPLENQPQLQTEKREEAMSDDEILEEISLALKQHCESICRNIKHPTDNELHEPLKLHDSSEPSDLSTPPDKPVKRPTKQVQQRTPFYRNIKTKRTLKKRR